VKQEHERMIPPPIALSLTLCEHLSVEEGTKNVSLAGTFTRRYGQAFPFVPLPFYVFATLTGAQGEGEITLTVTALETDEEVASLTRRVAFPDRFAEGRVSFRLNNCAFPAPGVYMFTLAVDGDWVAHRRLQVRQMEIEQ
jgi:hypothetical protein